MKLKRRWLPCGCWATEELDTGIVLECVTCPTCAKEAWDAIAKLTLGSKPESGSDQLRLF
jgi:hypothetical protein